MDPVYFVILFAVSVVFFVIRGIQIDLLKTRIEAIEKRLNEVL